MFRRLFTTASTSSNALRILRIQLARKTLLSSLNKKEIQLRSYSAQPSHDPPTQDLLSEVVPEITSTETPQHSIIDDIRKREVFSNWKVITLTMAKFGNNDVRVAISGLREKSQDVKKPPFFMTINDAKTFIRELDTALEKKDSKQDELIEFHGDEKYKLERKFNGSGALLVFKQIRAKYQHAFDLKPDEIPGFRHNLNRLLRSYNTWKENQKI